MEKDQVVRLLFRGGIDHPNPTEEAATQAGLIATAAGKLASWSERAQRRAAYTKRLLKALQDTMQYAELAFAQAAEEAIVDDETDEIAGTTSDIKGLHPQRGPS